MGPEDVVLSEFFRERNWVSSQICSSMKFHTITYCWWFRSPGNKTHQLRMVVDPIIYKVFITIPGGDRRSSEPSTVPQFGFFHQDVCFVDRLGLTSPRSNGLKIDGWVVRICLLLEPRNSYNSPKLLMVLFWPLMIYSWGYLTHYKQKGPSKFKNSCRKKQKNNGSTGSETKPGIFFLPLSWFNRYFPY